MPKKIKEKPKKQKLTKAEFEKKVLELTKEGMTSEKIGELLRQQGIHPKEHGVKISKILKENDKYINPDLKNTEEKLEKIEKHVGSSKQDKRAMRERVRIAARLRKLRKYFKIKK